MAELTSFLFFPGDSILHQLDIRFKLAFLVVLSLASMNAGFVELGLLSLLVIGSLSNARLPLKAVCRELRYFLMLLVFIFLARAFATAGQPILSLGFTSVTRQGLYSGLIVCWRLLVIVLLGMVFMATTRSSEIKSGAAWFLNPIPFISGKRIATMLSLLIRFVPVILNQARETAEAQKARGVENRKNPLYRMQMLGLPLLRRIFENGETLVVAMEARCFTEKRTDPNLSATSKDWLAAMFVAIFCSLILWL